VQPWRHSRFAELCELASPASRDLSEFTQHTGETTFSELATGKGSHEREREKHEVCRTLSGRSWAALTSGMADCGWRSR